MKGLVEAVLVGSGGFAGSVCRYLLTVAASHFGGPFPLGTLAANLLGCLVMGALSVFFLQFGQFGPGPRLLLATGFCGGFTTMSAFIHEVDKVARDGAPLLALGYLVLTLAGCCAALLAGAGMARWACLVWRAGS